MNDRPGAPVLMHIHGAGTTGSWLIHVGGISPRIVRGDATVMQQTRIGHQPVLPTRDLCIAHGAT